jgi:LysM repeat protein
MALGNLFKLAKLTIESYTDIERTKPLAGGIHGGNTLEVMYNPETLSTRHEVAFHSKKGISTHGAQTRWSHSAAEELEVKLVFDGTNVGYFGAQLVRPVPTVAAWIKAFLSLCYDVQSVSHETAYLRLRWNKGVLGADGFECRLKSAEIQYTAFDRDGSPLRAEVTATFIQALDPKKNAQKLRLSSPDLTHRVVVREGDTLPLLCQQIYGSAAHYLRVAQVNGLDDLRDLRAGQELFFPPFDRPERSSR